MRTKYILAVMSFATTVCFGQNENTMKSGLDKEKMDMQVNPGVDFYRYACGGWIDAHPLTPEYSRYGAFESLYEKNQQQLKSLIEEFAKGSNEQGSLAQKIGDLYNLAMDSIRLNSEGLSPLKNDLDRIKAIKKRSEILSVMASLGRKGISGYFNYGPSADEKNSHMNIVIIGQGGLSLGEREYYLDKDEATENIRKAFKKYIEQVFLMCGYKDTEARKMMEGVFRIETAIAKVSFSATQMRDPEKNYHKMTYRQFVADFKDIDWDLFFKTSGYPVFEEVNVAQLEPIREVGVILKTFPIEEQKAYMMFHLIDNASSYLSDDLRAAAFIFYGKVLSGKQADRPRWKRAVSIVDGVLGEPVGKMYVEKYFPASAKERMLTLVHNLQKALAQRIEAQEWMDKETKSKALEKLSTFYVKIGYPDKWRDYSGLKIDPKLSYWENLCKASEFETDYNIAKNVNKPVDRDTWFMNPQTVNAYYNPTTNEICFPAGILQPPFFDQEADDAFNYGAIGVVIGHEMTHGFDDQGRQYDKDGNLKDWWSKSDGDKFKERTKVMVDYFDNINVLPDLKANGELTLGENLADHGGLKVAFQALNNVMEKDSLPMKDGFSPAQRFYLAYANVWAGSIRDEEIRKRTKSDPHSLSKWRVNGALPHIADWYKAFGITKKDPMYIPVDKRVTIW